MFASHQPQPSATDQFHQQTRSALLCCAAGDALGAGVENWKLDEIIAFFGSNRELEYTRSVRPGKPITNGSAGDVTDDTSMASCVMSGLTRTMNEFLKRDHSAFNGGEFQQRALPAIFQAFLFWAQSQTTYSGISGKPCAAFVTDKDWPLLTAFHNTFGAGDGTMNILLQGKMGTLEKLPEKIPLNNKPEKTKYVDTCGALMRVMPIGLLCGKITSLDAFEFGCRSAAMTHGDPASYLATGIMAEIISERIREKKSLAAIIDSIKTRLVSRKNLARSAEEYAGYDVCIKTIDTAVNYLNDNGIYPITIMDTIGKSCGEKLFNTPPVLAQSLFVALAAERHFHNADTALKLAVIQSGDSDSVAAIAGGLLGAMGGKNAELSDKLVNGLNTHHLQALNRMADEFATAANLLAEKITLAQLLTSEAVKETTRVGLE